MTTLAPATGRVIVLACALASCAPTPSTTAKLDARDDAEVSLLGRVRRAPFVCPAGTQVYSAPWMPCITMSFEGMASRNCDAAAVEYRLCGFNFGTSGSGQSKAVICRRPDGTEHGPYEVIEQDGSIVAEGTCRNGVSVGAIFHWAHGEISDVLSCTGESEDGFDGVELRFYPQREEVIGLRYHGVSEGLDTCQRGTASFEVPATECHGRDRVFDLPAPRACAELEHAVCGLSFGTSKTGKVTACRRADGTMDGPIAATDPSSGREAYAACRDGRLAGALIRRRFGQLTEILSIHDGVLEGTSLRLSGRRLLDAKRYTAGVLYGDAGEP